MIHLRGCWINNGSGRSRLRAKRAALEEERRNATQKLIEELVAMQTPKLPPWWVNI